MPDPAPDLSDQEIRDRTTDMRAVRRAEMAEMDLDGRDLMVPKNGRDLLDKANAMAAAGPMVKDIFRDNPGACAGLILLCAPYRINPLQASWKCYQPKEGGPLAFEGQLVMAMINTAAPVRGRLRFTFDGEGQARRCTVTATDRDSGQEIEYVSPRLAEIQPKNSPLWKSDPDQQLCYYSARAFARRHYPEILLGVYDRDEIVPEGDLRADLRDVTPRAHREAESRAIIDVLDDGELLEEEPATAEVVP